VTAPTEKETSLSYLPPPTREALVKETIRLVAGCIAGVVLLGVVVYFLTM
jgi:hypothetical protein